MTGLNVSFLLLSDVLAELSLVTSQMAIVGNSYQYHMCKVGLFIVGMDSGWLTMYRIW